MPIETIHIEAIYVALAAGSITPILVGLITKYRADGGLKAMVTLVLTAVVAVVNSVVSTDGTFVVRDAILLFFTQFVTHVAVHFGVFRPAGIPQILAPDSGLGAPELMAP